MSVRKLKPITPGQRFRVVNGFDAITTDKPEKSLLAPKKRSGDIVLSISNVIKQEFLQKLRLSNMTQTELRLLHY